MMGDRRDDDALMRGHSDGAVPTAVIFGDSTGRRPAPAVLLHRLSGPLNALLARGLARRAFRDVIELFPTDQEAAEGGMITISMTVEVFCPACTGQLVGTHHRA